MFNPNGQAVAAIEGELSEVLIAALRQVKQGKNKVLLCFFLFL